MSKPSILIIRPSASVGGSCCGPLSNEHLKKDAAYTKQKEAAEKIRILYQLIKAEFGVRVEVQVIDSRDQLYLLLKLFKDSFRFKKGLRKCLKTLFTSNSTAVILNGCAVTNEWEQNHGIVLEKIRRVLE